MTHRVQLSPPHATRLELASLRPRVGPTGVRDLAGNGDSSVLDLACKGIMGVEGNVECGIRFLATDS
jgi:hypothetical protein